MGSWRSPEHNYQRSTDRYRANAEAGGILSAGLWGGLWRIYRVFGTRLVDGDVITYRKHPFTLFVKTWWQWVLFFGCLVVAGWVQSNIARALLGLVAFITFLWLAWLYLDWRNDLFQ